jgi:SAM-dependent methyltransferase
MKAFIKRLPGMKFLRGGWPDEARVIIQRPVFEKLLQGCELRGSCLNAGCREGLFVPFLDSFPGLTRIVHMDLKTPVLTQFSPDSRHEVVAGSLESLPFKDGEFDFIFCTEVLEHISDDMLAFREIGRSLRPGGLALLSAPTPPAPYDPAHVREGYTLNDFRDRFAAVRIEFVRHAYCFHGAMRLLVKLWRWQYERAHQRKSSMPRAMVLAFACCDRWFPVGRPFDIVVLGRKMSI